MSELKKRFKKMDLEDMSKYINNIIKEKRIEFIEEGYAPMYFDLNTQKIYIVKNQLRNIASNRYHIMYGLAHELIHAFRKDKGLRKTKVSLDEELIAGFVAAYVVFKDNPKELEKTIKNVKKIQLLYKILSKVERGELMSRFDLEEEDIENPEMIGIEYALELIGRKKEAKEILRKALYSTSEDIKSWLPEKYYKKFERFVGEFIRSLIEKRLLRRNKNANINVSAENEDKIGQLRYII